MKKLIVLFVLLSSAEFAQTAKTEECASNPAYAKLDFWVGEWDVFVADKKVGTNKIEKILRNCAVIENWSAGNGSEGKSVFYYNPFTKIWKQVWITDSGPIKEKTLIEELPDGAVRFQGEMEDEENGKYFDRTTLTPQKDGKVRQLIEVSKSGTKWTPMFDAIYVRANAPQSHKDEYSDRILWSWGSVRNDSPD